MDLRPYQPDPVIDGTFSALAYALKSKYRINRQYVTKEYPSNRLLAYLQQNYKVTGASYRDLTDPEKADAPVQDLSMLVVRDPRLDAFLLDFMGVPVVVIFFDDPEELRKINCGEIKEFPCGVYSLGQSMSGYVLNPVQVGSHEKPILEPGLMEALVCDTNTFFDRKDFYTANGLTHKRGILVIGEPGTGKSSWIKYYLSTLSGYYGLILDCANMYFGSGLMSYIRSMFGNENKVMVFEDVDGATRDYGSRSAFLNFIDGPTELSNTLFIASTNYPNSLDAALLERPSRFDVIYYIGAPSQPLRKEFLVKWFPELVNEPDRLEALATDTEGFTGAFFKEIFVIKNLRNSSIEEAIKIINGRRDMIKNFKESGSFDNGTSASGGGVRAHALEDYRIDVSLAKKIMGSK